MSGGKETPRQKMIGMMYLVLTALLALNVSNAVLEKFEIIDVTLGGLIKEDDNGNALKLESIKKATVTGAKEDAAKKQAADVRDLTKATLAKLDKLKTLMGSEKDGKAIEIGELVTNTNRSEELMLDHQKPEVGEDYEKELNEYVTNLNKIMGLKKPFEKLTRPRSITMLSRTVNTKTKRFLNFLSKAFRQWRLLPP